MFGDAIHLIVRIKPEQLADTIRELTRRRISNLVVPQSWEDARLFANDSDCSLLVLDPTVLYELIKQKSWFYISGLVAVLYQGSDREIYKQLVAMTNELQSYPWIRMIHIIYENTYFDWINKSFSDLLDGRYIQAEALKSI